MLKRLVAWHRGDWSIAYEGQWFGPYENKMAAAVAAIRIARTDPQLEVRLANEDGSTILIWGREPIALSYERSCEVGKVANW
jgi:hypothetical protein